MTQQQIDRRKAARRGVSLPNGIEILLRQGEGPARSIMAKLIDASPGGIGVETSARLTVGLQVALRANLRSSDLDLDFSGDGRVAHSREIAPGRFIVGLALEEVSYARAC